MKKLSKSMAMIALAVAGAGLPVVSVSAQESDRVRYTQIARDDLPRAVRQETDRMSEGAEDKKYQRQTRDGKTFYSVHFTNRDGRRMEARLDEAGKVVDGPHAARDQSGGSSRDRSGSSDDDRARDARPASDDDDAGVKFHGISNRDVQREVPRDVLRTMDQYTKNGKDLHYERQDRQGRIFYSVHYTDPDGKRMFVRVAESGQLALGPRESQATERNAANPDYARDRDRDSDRDRSGTTADRRRDDDIDRRTTAQSDSNAKREAITADDLPAEVRRTVEQTMANGGGHAFIRETRGGETSYVVEYEVKGQRTSARVAPSGKVLQASPLSPDTQVAQRTGTTDSREARTAAQNQSDAQVASARESASAPYGVIGTDQLPSAARSAVEQNIAGGSSDLLIQRFTRQGQTLYGVHFTSPEGRRSFMSVDQSGQVVIKPRESNWQEGGKNVRYELIGADQLPAEVRQQVQKQGGSEHLFVARTREGGRRTYMVQYTATGGERMEFEANENGKLVEEPRRAREQPFTILDRQGGRGEGREGERRERSRDRD